MNGDNPSTEVLIQSTIIKSTNQDFVISFQVFSFDNFPIDNFNNSNLFVVVYYGGLLSNRDLGISCPKYM
jgi:hypothetical protein